MTYKTDTQLVEESAAISIINSLLKEGVEISVYDPAGMGEAKKEIIDSDKVNFMESSNDCISGKKVCFIATPWKEFKSLSKDDFINLMDKKPIIFDGWNMFSFESSNDIEYISIGKES